MQFTITMIHQALRDCVQTRLASLTELDAEHVRALPAYRVEIVHGANRVRLSVQHLVTHRGEHHVIVQATRPRWLGLRTASETDGFALATTDRKRPLEAAEKLVPQAYWAHEACSLRGADFFNDPLRTPPITGSGLTRTG